MSPMLRKLPFALLLLALVTSTGRAVQTIDLTGYWEDDLGGKYAMKQVDDRLHWVGDARPTFVNVFDGILTGDTIRGDWVDVPGGQENTLGELTLCVDTPNRLVKTFSSGYGATIFTRVGTPVTKGLGRCAPGQRTPAQPGTSSGVGLGTPISPPSGPPGTTGASVGAYMNGCGPEQARVSNAVGRWQWLTGVPGEQRDLQVDGTMTSSTGTRFQWRDNGHPADGTVVMQFASAAGFTGNEPLVVLAQDRLTIKDGSGRVIAQKICGALGPAAASGASPAGPPPTVGPSAAPGSGPYLNGCGPEQARMPNAVGRWQWMGGVPGELRDLAVDGTGTSTIGMRFQWRDNGHPADGTVVMQFATAAGFTGNEPLVLLSKDRLTIKDGSGRLIGQRVCGALTPSATGSGAPPSGQPAGPGVLATGPVDGRTLNGPNLTYYPLASAQQCNAACQGNPNCRGWTWVKPGGYKAGDPAMCYLLSRIDAQVANSCCVSGVKGGSSTPSPGANGPMAIGPIDGRTLNGPNLTYYPLATSQGCNAACQANPNCRGWSWVKPGGYKAGDPAMCYLLSRIDAEVSSTCCVSGIKSGGAPAASAPASGFTGPEPLAVLSKDRITLKNTSGGLIAERVRR